MHLTIYSISKAHLVMYSAIHPGMNSLMHLMANLIIIMHLITINALNNIIMHQIIL